MQFSGNVMITSDLHLDLWLEKNPKYLDYEKDPFSLASDGFREILSGLDAIIIAGDLSDKPKVRWPAAFEFLAKHVDLSKVHVIPGNHDYYDHALDGDPRLQQICEDAGANFAQMTDLRIGNSRFLCCTLWTDFMLTGNRQEAMLDARRIMRDYRKIRISGSGFRPAMPNDTAAAHNLQRRWLETALSTSFDGPTIIVTHHAPMGACTDLAQPYAPAYASDLTDIIDKFQPDLWAYGHTHMSVDFQRGNTRIMNVSLGYPGEVPLDNVEALMSACIFQTGVNGQMPGMGLPDP